MSTFLHYAIDVSLSVLAVCGVFELMKLMLVAMAAFLSRIEFEWDDERNL